MTDAEAGYVDARVVLQAGNTMNLQQRFARLERDAAEIRAFNPVLVLGVLKTPAYAATVLGTSQDDPLVTGRMDRQRKLVTDRRRRWTLIQTEGALRWQARSATVMAEQIEHLIGLSTTPHVEVGVIGWRRCRPTTCLPTGVISRATSPLPRLRRCLRSLLRDDDRES